jgi:hypothetical protein
MEAIDNWRKSRYSGNGGNCVEVADHDNRVLVRDTKNRAGVVLRFSPGVWRRFAEQVKRSLTDPQPGLQGHSRVLRMPLRRVQGRFLVAGAARYSRCAARSAVPLRFPRSPVWPAPPLNFALPRSLVQSVPLQCVSGGGPRRKRRAQRPHLRAPCCTAGVWLVYGNCDEGAC